MKTMNIVPPSRQPREMWVTAKLKALVVTAFSIAGLVVCIGVWSSDCLLPVRIFALAAELLLAVASFCFWRFERPRELRLKGDFREPPVIHVK